MLTCTVLNIRVPLSPIDYGLLRASWDLISGVISTLIGVISRYNDITIVTLLITLLTKSHDPLSMDYTLKNSRTHVRTYGLSRTCGDFGSFGLLVSAEGV